MPGHITCFCTRNASGFYAQWTGKIDCEEVEKEVLRRLKKGSKLKSHERICCEEYSGDWRVHETHYRNHQCSTLVMCSS